MIVEALGRKYQIGFEHDDIPRDEEGKPLLDNKGKGVKARRTTTCFIFELGPDMRKDSRKLVCKGISICHKNDQFSRDKGRKNALTRALQQMWSGDVDGELKRAIRQQFWTVYLHRNRH